MDERIALLLKFKNVSATSFADKIDVQRSSISHILSGRNKPGLEFIQKVLKAYPEINPEWLVSGKGSMTRPPDLFAESGPSIPVLPNESHKENAHKEKQTLNENIKTKVVENALNEKQNKPRQPLIRDREGKAIERIIVFYTDKTFDTYYPSE